MLGIILIYFIGKYYYDLAKEYQKNHWLFAVIGVVSYYAGTFIGGLIIGAIMVSQDGGSALDDMSDIALGFMALPVGILACWGLYKLLKKQWSASGYEMHEVIDDIEE